MITPRVHARASLPAWLHLPLIVMADKCLPSRGYIVMAVK